MVDFTLILFFLFFVFKNSLWVKAVFSQFDTARCFNSTREMSPRLHLNEDRERRRLFRVQQEIGNPEVAFIQSIWWSDTGFFFSLLRTNMLQKHQGVCYREGKMTEDGVEGHSERQRGCLAVHTCPKSELEQKTKQSVHITSIGLCSPAVATFGQWDGMWAGSRGTL